MTWNHHRFTYTSFIPVGDFVRQVCEWTGKEPVDVLDVLRGSDPDRAYMACDRSVVRELLDALRSDAAACGLLATVERAPERANRVLDELLGFGGSIERGLLLLLEQLGYRIIDGYDLCSETFVERPDLLLNAIGSMLHNKAPASLQERAERAKRLRAQVPESKRPIFDVMLQDAWEMDRLRDERGMYSDLWAIGILRHAFQEAGNRLAQRGQLRSPALALDA
jgi:pyruvate,water dikinase